MTETYMELQGTVKSSEVPEQPPPPPPPATPEDVVLLREIRDALKK